MNEEYSGNMMAELMSTVARIVPQLDKGFCVSAEQRETLTLLRQKMLSNGRGPTPLKSAWLNTIDLCLSDNPSPALLFAAMQEVDRHAPANGAKAISVNLI
jgi:hypothetical protein